jgi:hypothetical protein
MKKGYNLGFIEPQSRDELHDRAKLRVVSEQGRGPGNGEKASGDYLPELKADRRVYGSRCAMVFAMSL